MRNVIYVVPAPGENSLRFVRAIKGLEDVRMLGIVNRTAWGVDPVSAGCFDHIVQVADATNADQVADTVRGFEKLYGPIHRVTGALEQLQPMLAEVRARTGVPGMMPDAIARFTDKNVMKTALRAAGLPCARHKAATSPAEAEAFVATVGLPVVMKPPVGAGCRDTYLVSTQQELAEALRETAPATTRPLQIEEFISGEENSFETITVAGRVRLKSVTRYFPGPLDAVRNPWIQYTIVLPREIDRPEFQDILDVGARAVEALGMESGYTHMEWFRTADGRTIISEVAARPPGVHIVPMMNYAYEQDFYRVWARAVVDDAFDGPFERKYACGVAFLRGVGTGWVASVEGLDQVREAIGDLVVEANIPQPGVPKAAGYEGEGHIIIRAPHTETIERALQFIIQTVKVRYRS